MQERTQVNPVKNGLFDYGLLLYILASVVFGQAIIYIITNLAVVNYISISPTWMVLINGISQWLFASLSVFIIFILMIEAIIINSKSHDHLTNRISILSILWFTFYFIWQIILWLIQLGIIKSGDEYIINGKFFFGFIQYAIEILSIIFQLIVWISLFTFFNTQKDKLPVTSNKKIQNILIFLIVIMVLLMYSVTFYIALPENPFALSLDNVHPLYIAYYLLFNVSTDIFLIIGYSLLGYRFRKLKNSADTLINE